jgi:sn-glycerol 3-phosphate transport system permease protein
VTPAPVPSAGPLATSPPPLAPPSQAARKLGRYLLLVAVAAVVLFPIYMLVVTSLLTTAQIASRPPYLFPTSPQWGDYSKAFSVGDLGVYMRNSAIQASAITVGVVLTSVLAAYAFSFVVFPLRRLLFGLTLASLMVPAEVTIIPNYQTVANFGWLNTYPALVVPFLASGIGIFLFRQAFFGLPGELRDAARLDGLGHFKFLARVVVPLSLPMIGAFAVFSFLGAWNQYLWPLLVTRTSTVETVQIGLRQLVGTTFSDIGVRAAGTVLAALPILVVLVVFQKSLVRGLTSGAVKG